jgi:GNAT superfamily N-acetyltransferase
MIGTIEPLTAESLHPAVALLSEVFPTEKRLIRLSLRYALRAVERPEGCTGQPSPRFAVRYWVARRDTGEVAGVCGLYSRKSDAPTVRWVGWFGVAAGFRRRGTGRSLLTHVLRAATQAGANTVRLYTKTDVHPDAEALYRRLGFRQTGPQTLGGELVTCWLLESPSVSPKACES